MYFREQGMKLVVNYILGAMLLLLATRGEAQNRTQVLALVYSIDSNNAVPLASIVNRQSGQKRIATRIGFVRLQLLPTDTIEVTAVGYESELLSGAFLIPDSISDTVHIYMKPKAYLLQDVTIRYSNRKRDSLAQVAAEILKSDPLLNNYDRVLNRNEGGIMSPLTAIWNEYSKAGQDMRKFEEFMRHAQLLNQVNTRYNKKSIKRATGLDDEWLDAYILYCNISKTFVLSASDYDLIVAMRECADRFRKEKNID
jgi:hypothetical protein